MGEFDELESIADMFLPEQEKPTNRMSRKGRAACRAAMLDCMDRGHKKRRAPLVRLKYSAKQRHRHRSAPITLAPIRGATP